MATRSNEKLPVEDRPRIETAIAQYHEWIAGLRAVKGTPDEVVCALVDQLNQYRLRVDVDLVFDSPNDFLYRQKGQLKLDNSIVEEFIPWLIQPAVIPELSAGLGVGPSSCFSAVYFESSLADAGKGAGLRLRSKDQDFSISRRVYLRTSLTPDFKDYGDAATDIAYVAAEIKTNLDKTMFQEACATAHDVKTAVPGSRYYLLCEWLDMTPISTATTDIDEVLILRGAKRMNSNVRSGFGTASGRAKQRDEYIKFLKANPLRRDIFVRFVNHVRGMLTAKDPVEKDVLLSGFF